MVIALVGNQNSGKTSIFNQVTKMNQHVGNFPGVTVDITIGKIKNSNLEIVDLPGLYSLSTYSKDENVTRDFLYKNKPEVIINVIDCMNLQRSLYLTLQLKETGIPIVVALNMLDELEKSHGTIDIKKLEAILDLPIIPITQITEDEIDNLIKKAKQIGKKKELVYEITEGKASKKYAKIDEIYKQVVSLGINKREQKSYKIDNILTSKIFRNTNIYFYNVYDF